MGGGTQLPHYNESAVYSLTESFDWYQHWWPWLTGLEWHNGHYFALLGWMSAFKDNYVKLGKSRPIVSASGNENVAQRIQFLAVYDLWHYSNRLLRTSRPTLMRGIPLSKLIIWPIPHDNWKMVRDRCVLFANMKSHMGFRQILKSVILNEWEWHNDCRCALFPCSWTCCFNECQDILKLWLCYHSTILQGQMRTEDSQPFRSRAICCQERIGQ